MSEPPKESPGILPLDTITGILAHLQPMVCYRWKEDIVQGIFYSHRNHNLFKDWMWFDQDNYSRTLHQQWTSAHICRLYTWVDLKYIMVTYKQNKILAGKLTKFSTDHLALFKEIAQRFYDELEIE